MSFEIIIGSMLTVFSRLVSQETCKNMFTRINTKFKILDDNLCASSTEGDSCTGDSGGGLVMTSCPGG